MTIELIFKVVIIKLDVFLTKDNLFGKLITILVIGSYGIE